MQQQSSPVVILVPDLHDSTSKVGARIPSEIRFGIELRKNVGQSCSR